MSHGKSKKISFYAVIWRKESAACSQLKKDYLCNCES